MMEMTADFDGPAFPQVALAVGRDARPILHVISHAISHT
jgi:hypothetical protein